jgi:hypothetical protein
VPVFWRVNAFDAKLLAHKLTPPHDPYTAPFDIQSSNPDVRHQARMRSSSVKYLAHISPLTETLLKNGNIDDILIDWTSDRAWFDECVKVT